MIHQFDNIRIINLNQQCCFISICCRANQVIVDDIRHGNSEPYGAEPLRDLLKLLPENEEVRERLTHTHTHTQTSSLHGVFPPLKVQKLRSYRGNVSKLSLADSFIYLLIQLPR